MKPDNERRLAAIVANLGNAACCPSHEFVDFVGQLSQRGEIGDIAEGVRSFLDVWPDSAKAINNRLPGVIARQYLPTVTHFDHRKSISLSRLRRGWVNEVRDALTDRDRLPQVFAGIAEVVNAMQPERRASSTTSVPESSSKAPSSGAMDCHARRARIRALRAVYAAHIAKHPKRKFLQRILDALFETPTITAPQVAELNVVTASIAAHQITILVRLGILERSVGTTSPATYIASEIVPVSRT